MLKRRRPLRANRRETQDALRSAIIDAARQLFRKGGYEAVSMRNVAKRVGYTAGALYRYFPDKHSLLLHVWEDDMRYAAEYIRGATDSIEAPVDKVRQTFLSYLRYWTQNPDNFRVLFGPASGEIDRADAPDAFPTTGPTALYFETREYLAKALAGRKNAPKDPDLAMQCLLSAVHGVMALSASASQFPWFDLQQMAAVTIDSMLAGWGAIERPRTLATAVVRRQRPESARESRHLKSARFPEARASVRRGRARRTRQDAR